MSKEYFARRASALALAQNRCQCVGECGRSHRGLGCGVPNATAIVRHPSAFEDWVAAESEEGKQRLRAGARRDFIVLDLVTSSEHEAPIVCCGPCRRIIQVPAAKDPRRADRQLGMFE